MDISKAFLVLAGIFLLLGLVGNLNSTQIPKLPGDIYIDKPGIKVYIPVTSAVVLSVVLSLLFNFFRR